MDSLVKNTVAANLRNYSGEVWFLSPSNRVKNTFAKAEVIVIKILPRRLQAATA
jgi:hypothetical protein